MRTYKRVSVVEREGIILLDIKEILQSYKSETISIFRNINSLFDSLSKERPDLIIIDSQEESVPDKLKIITEELKIPVLYLSEYPGDRVLSMNLRGCMLLKKPYLKKDFIAALKKSTG